MRFFLDHDVPRLVGEALARHEHEVLILSEHLPVTSTDEEVFAFAIAGGLIMVTCNRDDFLALATTRDHPGLIILIRRRSAASEQWHILRLLEIAGETGITANINFA